jgi:hypothetical protein
MDVKGNEVVILFNEKQNYCHAFRPKVISIYFIKVNTVVNVKSLPIFLKNNK